MNIDLKGDKIADYVRTAYRVSINRDPKPTGLIFRVKFLEEDGHDCLAFLLNIIRSDEFRKKEKLINKIKIKDTRWSFADAIWTGFNGRIIINGHSPVSMKLWGRT